DTGGPMADLPARALNGYDGVVRGLNRRIREAQLHAWPSVKRELVVHDWQIRDGARMREERPGRAAKAVDRVVADLGGAGPARPPGQGPDDLRQDAPRAAVRAGPAGREGPVQLRLPHPWPRRPGAGA